MTNNLEMKEINSLDIRETVQFHNRIYNDNRTSEQWNWEYRGNYPNTFVFTIVKDKNTKRIVGTQGMIPIYLNIKGKRYFSGKSENSLLDSNFRGGTLFQDLYEFAVVKCKSKQMYCIWGFTSAAKVWREKLKFEVYKNNLKESKIILNFGATAFDTIQSNVKNVLKALKHRQTSIRKVVTSFFEKLRNMSGLLSGSKPDLGIEEKSVSVNSYKKESLKEHYKIERNLHAGEDIKTLYSRLRKKYPNLVHIDQDKKYLQWRIFKNPIVNYDTYFIYEKDLLRGYCYINTSSRRIGFISDLTFETSEAGAFLLGKLLNELRAKKIIYLYFFGNIKNQMMARVFQLLKQFGAKISDSDQYFVLRNLSYPDEEWLLDIKNWYLNGLWSEGYK